MNHEEGFILCMRYLFRSQSSKWARLFSGLCPTMSIRAVRHSSAFGQVMFCMATSSRATFSAGRGCDGCHHSSRSSCRGVVVLVCNNVPEKMVLCFARSIVLQRMQPLRLRVHCLHMQGESNYHLLRNVVPDCYNDYSSTRASVMAGRAARQKKIYDCPAAFEYILLAPALLLVVSLVPTWWLHAHSKAGCDR